MRSSTQNRHVHASELGTAQPKADITVGDNDLTRSEVHGMHTPLSSRGEICRSPRSESNMCGQVLGRLTETPDSASQTESLMETYFSYLHRNPYHIFNESVMRRRWCDRAIPRFIINAICAVAVKHASSASSSHSEAGSLIETYFLQARAEIDMEEPRIDSILAILLLVSTSIQSGKDRRAYMLLSHAIGMAFALGRNCESPAPLCMGSEDNEGYRRIFWTCYVMDRFVATGSQRPPAISDGSIHLRLPAFECPVSGHVTEGIYFPSGASFACAAKASSIRGSSGALLVQIVQIFALINRYLSMEGMMGELGFPWHPESTHMCIQSRLEHWNAAFQDLCATLDALFDHPESSVLVLCRLVYHASYCLIYRPFLPMVLSEDSMSGQHGAWRKEATRLSFFHANAIGDVVEKGKAKLYSNFPPFISYCILTAGSIHVHGAHYTGKRDKELYGRSIEFLSSGMQLLAYLRFVWTGIHHHWHTLHTFYTSHSELVRSYASAATRPDPGCQTMDFFERYPDVKFDEAHVSFTLIPSRELFNTTP